MPKPPKTRHDPPSPDDFDCAEEQEGQDSRRLFLIGDVTEGLVKRVTIGLFRLAEQDDSTPIYIIVNTYGGSIDEAFALYDAIQLCPAPVRTVGIGKVMSSGCLILAAGEKGHRIMGGRSRLMYHGGHEVNSGDIFEQENNSREFKRLETLFDSLVAQETGRSLKQVQDLYMKKRLDHFMTAQQAKTFGFVDIVR